MFKEIYTDDLEHYAEELESKDLDEAREVRAWVYETTMDRLEVLTSGTIIAIGDIMTLNGRRTAYRLMGNCVNQVLYSKDNKELNVYFDGSDVRAEDRVDGGVNYYLYRELKNDEQSFPFLKKIYNQEYVSTNEIEKYTNSLAKYIKEIYVI